MVKLDIGGGNSPEKGFLNVDPYVSTADINKDLFDLEYKDEVEEIICAAVLEHLPYFKVIPALKKMRDMLIPGRVVTLMVPDHVWLCKMYLHADEESRGDFWTHCFYGNQNHEGEFHRSCFSEGAIKFCIKHSGLVLEHFSETWRYNQKMFFMRARRLL